MSESVFLPKNVRPRKYTLFLDPSLETFEFQGKVTIDLDVVESCSAITFHADRLEIFSAELLLNGTPLDLGTSTVPRIDLDLQSQRATVSLGSYVLHPGPLQMELTFKGILNDDMMGFYRASYLVDGKQQWMACTQFEAIGARRALPCWDEPSWKAVFEVTMAVPPGLIGLSNMPVVERRTRADGKSVLRYAPTPVMSSYLLAFVVGDMERVSSRTKEGVEVNVYTVPGVKQQGQFAVEAAAQIISFFAEYFDIAYPLPKADLVAIPDFAAGAMENWGLVCFRDTALLLDQASSSASAFQEVAETVSHELAHQWFGNLVTMQWWSDLWLNEGFATWVGTLGVDHIKPEYGVWTQFVSSEMVKALETDSLLSSHPVEVEINDPDEIEQVFDNLSYSKGASILRQLNAAVGPLSFQQGLREYLSTHQYSNTVTNDLWKSVGAASGQPVETQMQGWTRQMGYPLITVLGRAPGGGLKLSQTRFLSKGLPTPQENSLWSVPVTAVVGGEMKTFILDEREGVAEEFKIAEGGWLKLNADQVGFFRVNYPPQMWTGLEEGVAAGQLGVLDRLGILMDAFALAKAGVLQTTQALQLALAYIDEKEYTVWSQVSGSWAEVALLLSVTPHLHAFEAVGLGLFLPIADKIGWEPVEGESHQDALLRPLVLRRLAEYGHAGTIQKCQEMFQKMIKDPKSVAADLRYLVASVAVMEGGREEFEATKKLYREADVADFKEDCLFAMGYTQKKELIEEYLDFGFDEKEVKSQNTSYVLSILATNDAGKELGWSYVKRNWDAIYARFRNSSGLFQRFVTAPISTFCTMAKAQDAEMFFQANPVPEASMDLNRALENIKTRAAWLNRDHRSIVEWLESRPSKR